MTAKPLLLALLGALLLSAAALYVQVIKKDLREDTEAMDTNQPQYD